MQVKKKLYFIKDGGESFIIIKEDEVNGILKELIKEVNLSNKNLYKRKKELLKNQFDEKEIISFILDFKRK